MLGRRSWPAQAAAQSCGSSRRQWPLPAPRNAALHAKQHVAPAPAARSRGVRSQPRQPSQPRAQAKDSPDSDTQLVRDAGEDAGAFDLESQSVRSWAYFFGVLGTVLAILYAARPHPPITRFHTPRRRPSFLSSTHHVVKTGSLGICSL